MEPEASGEPVPARRSRAKVIVFVAVLLIAAAFAFLAGRSTANADRIAVLVKSNQLIGKNAQEIRGLVPGVVFEGGTENSTTVCKSPGTFGDAYFQVTFKDGKVIGARTMGGPSGKAPVGD